MLALAVAVTLAAVGFDLATAGDSRPARQLYGGPFVQVGDTLGRLPALGQLRHAGPAARRRRRAVVGLARGRAAPRGAPPSRLRARPAALRIHRAARPVHDGGLAGARPRLRAPPRRHSPGDRRALARRRSRRRRRARRPVRGRRRRAARRRRSSVRPRPGMALDAPRLPLLPGALPDPHRLGLAGRRESSRTPGDLIGRDSATHCSPTSSGRSGSKAPPVRFDDSRAAASGAAATPAFGASAFPAPSSGGQTTPSTPSRAAHAAASALHVRLDLIPGAGHLSMLARPAAVAAAIERVGPPLIRTRQACRGHRSTSPELPLAEWEATKNTLHLWAQIVGKMRHGLDALRATTGGTCRSTSTCAG